MDGGKARAPIASTLPTGTVTFLFTDIEGSTSRWERAPQQMTEALAQHDAALAAAIDRGRGVLCQTAGDSFVVAFESATDALETALSAQRALREEVWPEQIGRLGVRMALHTGTATLRGDFYDANHALTRQSRIVAIAAAGQILVSETTHALLGDGLPDGVDLFDLGKLWLKDLLEPIRVFRVVAPGPPWSLPEPSSGGTKGLGADLPVPPHPFIGRQESVDEVSASIVSGDNRLTTIVGAGGMGKTRLALRSARSVRHRFSDGVVFVDLSAITEPDLVVPMIATAIDPGNNDVSVDELADKISEQALLLVLDNLEQVMGATPLIERLVQRTTAPRVLVTSRIPLGVEAETTYELSPLGLPDLDVDDAELVGGIHSDAVALFVERASAARPDFVLTEANVRSVAAICHRLDGIPLALVLAAARTKILTPSMMLERLDRSLSLLTRGGPDLPARQQTLRAAIDWSYELLEDDEKANFARWSVFAGGFRLEAAHAIGSEEDLLVTVDDVAALVDNSLLTATETIDGQMRYRMLETINEYAREKLRSQSDHADVAHLHTQFFLDLAEEAAPRLEDEQLALWSARLEEDLENFRVALAHSLERAERGEAEGAEQMVRLAASLALFWHDRGYLREGSGYLQAALDVAPIWEATGPEAAERASGASAAILDYLGSIARRRGDLPAAHHFLQTALEIHGRIDDPRGHGRVLAALASLLRQEEDVDGARSAAQRSLELARSTDDTFTVVNGLLTIGNIERDVGNTAGALPFYESALETARSIHEYIGVSVALNNSANLAIGFGDLQRAWELHVESLEIRHDLRHDIMMAESLVGLAAVEAGQGRMGSAGTLVGFAKHLADEVGADFDPEERRIYNETREAVRAELGAQAAGEAEDAGRAMALEAVIDLVRSTRFGD